MKFWILVVLCLTLGLKNESSAQNVDCEYQDFFIGVVGHKNLSRSFYTCFLKTKNSNFSYDGPLNIQGQHLRRRSDEQVEYLSAENGELLRKFSSEFCKKFSNLEILLVRNAKTESIDENALQNCEKLFYLGINGNEIRELPPNLLIRNSKLEIIFIINNKQLTTLPQNFFINQKNLGTLDLHGNQLNFLPSGLFSSLEKLQILYLNSNRLQTVDPLWFENLQNLEKLGLNDNQLSELPVGAFKSLKKLEELYVYKNKIKTLHPGCFVGLENLKLLSLFENKISDLPHGVFSDLRNLEHLGLFKNQISVLHSDSFGLHSRLTRIDIEENKITAIDEKIIDNSTVSFINMENNICNSEILESRNDIKTHLKTCFENYRPRQQATTTQSPSTIKPFVTQKPVIKSTTENERVSTCGQRKKSKGNIVGGSFIESGDYPWIAAFVNRTAHFFCGGVLVSEKKVVTAAHCMLNIGDPKTRLARDFDVLLGAHDLDSKIDRHRVIYAVQSVNVHDDWNPYTTSVDADIAVLILEESVTFNNYIQPVCLIDPQSEIAKITQGIVVGFGRTESSGEKPSNVPKVIDTPLQTNPTCFKSHYLFKSLSSGRTFCAGTGTGVGVCQGDSGGGLYVQSGDIYYLRGIVSTSIINGPYGCDLDNFAIFTNMLKFNDWVNSVMTPQHYLVE